MSRQSKAVKKNAEAKAWSKLRTGGGKGPARTTAKHGKVNTLAAQKERDRQRDIAQAKAEEAKAAQKAADKAKDAKKKAPAANKPQHKKAA